MSFKRSNKMTVSQQKTMDDLFSIMSKSNDAGLQDLVNHRNLVRTFTSGFDSTESEQVEYSNADPDNELTREYARRKDAMRNVGTNSSDFDKNRDAIMRESRNTDSLTQQNAAKSRDFDAFSKPAYR